MLDEKRIKEAQKNVKSYLDDGILSKTSSLREEVFETYKRNYKESFDVADKLFGDNSSNLWAVVCSYYSMFYITNAVLYKLGYKTGHKIVHKITSDALIVFIRDKLKKSLIEDYEEAKEDALSVMGRKTDEIIQSYDNEMEKRSVFQYTSTEEIKKSKAKTSLERAKQFIHDMEKLLL
ncbi:MAG: HEPN domain-containing protein [Nanoarchaeota archaeon]|nr:HEPN domain-containing protein [Nanoarchaeota archaeon]